MKTLFQELYGDMVVMYMLERTVKNNQGQTNVKKYCWQILESQKLINYSQMLGP